MKIKGKLIYCCVDTFIGVGNLFCLGSPALRFENQTQRLILQKEQGETREKREKEGGYDDEECEWCVFAGHLLDPPISVTARSSNLADPTVQRHQVRLRGNPEQRRRFGRLRRHFRRPLPLPHHLRQGLLAFPNFLFRVLNNCDARISIWMMHILEKQKPNVSKLTKNRSERFAYFIGGGNRKCHLDLALDLFVTCYVCDC